MAALRLQAQDGPQTQFLSTTADIAIYGGAAGGGKTFGLLLEPLRHFENKKFGCVIFRRNTTQIRNEGGLWDESVNLYPHFRAAPRESSLEWVFVHGMRVKFAHLEYDRTVLDWQGSQIPLIGFDELTHFTEKQFFYMLSRNRSTSGVPGYIRATTNPDPDSWVRKFIDWWIDDKGYAIKERSGVIRWFIRRDDLIVWGDSKEELFEKFGRNPEVQPKSVTFITAKLDDNKILMDKDPSYLASLLAMSRVDRLRLKDGNWNVRAGAGMYFRREEAKVIDAIPAGWTSVIRFWDRAASEVSEVNKDPDWTRGLKLYGYPNGSYVIADLKSTQSRPSGVETLIKNTASHDGYSVAIRCQQDPGSAGVSEAERFVKMLSGYDVNTITFQKDKETRAKAVSAQWENGNVYVLRAPWNDELFLELENFPEGTHDDIVDVLSGAFNEVADGGNIFNAL